jgi:hypothetical protein
MKTIKLFIIILVIFGARVTTYAADASLYIYPQTNAVKKTLPKYMELYHEYNSQFCLNEGTWVYRADNTYPAVAYMAGETSYKGEKDFDDNIYYDVSFTYNQRNQDWLEGNETLSSNVVPYTCASWGNYNYLLVSYNNHEILDPKMLFVGSTVDNLSNVTFEESKTRNIEPMNFFAKENSLNFKKIVLNDSAPLYRGCYNDTELLIVGKQKYSDFLKKLNYDIKNRLFFKNPGTFCNSGPDLLKHNPDSSGYWHWYYNEDEPFSSIIYCQKAEKSSDDRYYLVYVNPS